VSGGRAEGLNLKYFNYPLKSSLIDPTN
jgi:hypothetical protein